MPWFIRRAQRASVSVRRSGAVSVAAVALVIAGCGGGVQTSADFDPAGDFSARTYSWRDGTPLPNPLMGQRLVGAVDNQLQQKGFKRVPEGGDITVTYHAAADKQLDVQTFSTGSPYGCWGGCMSGSMTSSTVTPVTVGTVIVDLVDTKSNKMLWRGSASDAVSSDPKENEQKIYEGVSKMFSEFPPKKK